VISAVTSDIPPESKPLFGRILLVEDDEVTSLWLAQSLEKFGLEVHRAASAAQAFQVAQQKSFHAVVTDVFLEDGLPHGIRVVAEFAAQGLPVLMMTSKASTQLVKEALNAGAFYFVEKPFDPKDLADALNRSWDEVRGHQGMLEHFMDGFHLTPKEKEITRLILKGLSNREVAEISGNTEKTIKFHLTTIFQKCGVSSRTELFNAIFPT
jgi:DNA-binding NarL/FixJ family response regulator